LAILTLCLLAATGGRTAENPPKNHWSFQPVTRPPIPQPRAGPLTTRNPIDSFIDAKLAQDRLDRSPEADRRTLIRRIYFDLVGLPPAPEEVAAFVRDTLPDAYEQRVDRLLASPRYGERWARHWLDVVRFAETHGFEMNQPRPNAWPYRDYVIRAFNADIPYDRFILEQIAGDALGVDEATGFLVAGPWDQVKSPDEVLTRNQRADELHDMVAATGTTFLGLTLGCARCHDHKFDPIPQRDYYAIKAGFEGVHHGERERPAQDTAARAAAVATAQARLKEIEAALIEYEPLAQTGPNIDGRRLRAPVHPRLNVERFGPIPARRLRFTINATTDAEPCIDELEVFAAAPENALSGTAGGLDCGGPPPLSGAPPAPPRSDDVAGPAATRRAILLNVALASRGVRVSASGTYPNSELHKLEHLNDGRTGNSRSWISNEKGRGWVELEFPHIVTIQRVVWSRDREGKFNDRLTTDYRIEVAADDGEWKLVASSADRRPFKAGEPFTDDLPTDALNPDQRERLRALAAERTALREKLNSLTSKSMIYAGEFKTPEPTRRWQRGDPMQPRENVEPGFLSNIALPRDGRGPGGSAVAWTADADGAVPSPTPEQQRRLALARWIASPENPLTARVIVNRLWQYHFGEGLVGTPGDFGRNGTPPTHPELLDWLAAELVDRGWSLKHIHRLILTSATYRQSSDTQPAGRASPRAPFLVQKGSPGVSPSQVDAGNRLLWRFASRRLEAEPLRDSILAVAGRLDLRMGGPGWSPFEPNDNYVRVYTPKQSFEPGDFRRMIYGSVVRQRPDGVFGAFDCPDGSQVAPKRTRSTTPLQALNLLNSGFMIQAAAMFARRLEADSGPGAPGQAQRAFELAFQRSPSGPELEAAAELIRRHGIEALCRALFNANEFLYVY
jgi:hypothetical protein